MTDVCLLKEDEESENIVQMRRVVNDLPVPPPLVFVPFLGNVMQADVISGANSVIMLHKTVDIAIALAIGAPGTIVERHVHEQHKWIGVIKGRMFVTFNGEEDKEFGPNEVCYLPPNSPHVVTYTEYSEVWVITQPSDPSWPDVSE